MDCHHKQKLWCRSLLCVRNRCFLDCGELLVMKPLKMRPHFCSAGFKFLFLSGDASHSLLSFWLNQLSEGPPLLSILEVSLLLLLLLTPKVKCLLSMLPLNPEENLRRNCGRLRIWWSKEERVKVALDLRLSNSSQSSRLVQLPSSRISWIHALRPLSVCYTKYVGVCEMTTWFTLV